MKRPIVALACLGFLASAAAAEEPPVAVAPGQVDSEPQVTTRDFQGHKAWSLLWYRDAKGRELHIGYIEGMEQPYRKRPIEMLKFMHDGSSDDEAELREIVNRRRREPTYRPIVLIENASFEQVVAVRARQLELTGIYAAPVPSRRYPAALVMRANGAGGGKRRIDSTR